MTKARISVNKGTQNHHGEVSPYPNNENDTNFMYLYQHPISLRIGLGSCESKNYRCNLRRMQDKRV